jgi:hypothetical protein
MKVLTECRIPPNDCRVGAGCSYLDPVQVRVRSRQVDWDSGAKKSAGPDPAVEKRTRAGL